MSSITHTVKNPITDLPVAPTQEKIYTRIDFRQLPDGTVKVRKYEEGWVGDSMYFDESIQAEMTIAEMAAWCKGRGWRVIEWPAVPEIGLPAGARAFKGGMMPVRNKYAIKGLRRTLDEKKSNFYRRTIVEPGDEISIRLTTVGNLDLRYAL